MTAPINRSRAHLAETLADARRAVLVRRPLHWRVAAALIAHLEAARGALERRDTLAEQRAHARDDVSEGRSVAAAGVVEPEQP